MKPTLQRQADRDAFDPRDWLDRALAATKRSNTFGRRGAMALHAVAALLVCCGALVSDRKPTHACAMAVSRTVAMPLIEGEEALIVWDPTTQMEHFVRRANFGGARGPFGFIVPTPSQPQLHEADDRVFSLLADLYTAPVAPSARRSRSAGGLAGSDAVSNSVQVVATARVAGLDATVLRATDARALASWLGNNGFDSRPALANWLRPYTTGTWHVTAFRYVGATGIADFGARAVRLSFRTDRPFYPYAEPDDQRPSRGARRAARPFRVSVITAHRVAGTVAGRPWQARVAFAERRSLRAVLTSVIPESTADALWMTTFDESNSVRGAGDLWFARASAQTNVAPSVARVANPLLAF